MSFSSEQQVYSWLKMSAETRGGIQGIHCGDSLVDFSVLQLLANRHTGNSSLLSQSHVCSFFFTTQNIVLTPAAGQMATLVVKHFCPDSL